MLNKTELQTLLKQLPNNWVELVMEKTNFKGTKIREALRLPAKYDAQVIDAAILVAKEHKEAELAKAQEQKKRIKELSL